MALRAYIVEDNPIVLANVTEALEEVASARIVGTAASAPAANEWLGGHGEDWDLAVVDLFLAGSSGLEVLASCRERLARQRVIVLTNYATPEIRRRCAELGADAVFDKSTEIDELFTYCSEMPGA